MRISDWSADVCSSDLKHAASERPVRRLVSIRPLLFDKPLVGQHERGDRQRLDPRPLGKVGDHLVLKGKPHDHTPFSLRDTRRSEEHTSALQSLLRISYAVFCLKNKTTQTLRPIIHCRTHHSRMINTISY